MGKQIEFIVEWTVTGDTDAFKRAARGATMMVLREEPNALRYQWYVDEHGKTFVLTECYADSDAMLLHHRNIARHLPALNALGRVTRFEILGDLSPEAEGAAAQMGAKRLRYWEGVNR